MIPTRSPQRRYRLLCLVTLALLLTACTEEEPDEEESAAMPLVGSWLRIHPPGTTTDTLRLRADGAASGAAAGLDDGYTRVTRWRIGSAVMPEGFCWAEADNWICQGYRVRNDTLSLANGNSTTYVRVRSTASR